MAAENPDRAWLEEFRREVGGLRESAEAPSRASGGLAEAAFESWWRSEQEGWFDRRGGDARPEPGPLPRESAEMLDRLARENAAGQAEAAFLRQEIASLREQMISLIQEKELAEKTCRCLEAHTQELGEELRRLREKTAEDAKRGKA